jgi:thioredoxin
MSDFNTDPELQAILKKKAEALKRRASFFDKINPNGVTHVNDLNIDEIINNAPLPVLVDFSADAWCKPCLVLSPILEELSHEYTRRLLFLKLNTDQNQRSAQKYRIFSLPTLMIFNRGRKIAQRVGLSSKSNFKSWINEVLHQISHQS